VIAAESTEVKTVLVIEDDAIACKGLSVVLENEGYEVVIA